MKLKNYRYAQHQHVNGESFIGISYENDVIDQTWQLISNQISSKLAHMNRNLYIFYSYNGRCISRALVINTG